MPIMLDSFTSPGGKSLQTRFSQIGMMSGDDIVLI